MRAHVLTHANVRIYVRTRTGAQRTLRVHTRSHSYSRKQVHIHVRARQHICGYVHVRTRTYVILENPLNADFSDLKRFFRKYTDAYLLSCKIYKVTSTLRHVPPHIQAQ